MKKTFVVDDSSEVEVSVEGDVTRGIRLTHTLAQSVITTCTCSDTDGKTYSITKHCDGDCDCSNPKFPRVICR